MIGTPGINLASRRRLYLCCGWVGGACEPFRLCELSFVSGGVGGSAEASIKCSLFFFVPSLGDNRDSRQAASSMGVESSL